MDKSMVLWTFDDDQKMFIDKVRCIRCTTSRQPRDSLQGRVGEIGGNTLGFYGCVWGYSLSYLSHFIRKTNESLSRAAATLHSSFAFSHVRCSERGVWAKRMQRGERMQRDVMVSAIMASSHDKLVLHDLGSCVEWASTGGLSRFLIKLFFFG